jgi:hypothetical protein
MQTTTKPQKSTGKYEYRVVDHPVREGHVEVPA